MAMFAAILTFIGVFASICAIGLPWASKTRYVWYYDQNVSSRKHPYEP